MFVDAQGFISEAPVYDLSIANHIVRVSVSVKDTLLGSIRSDVSMGLYDETGTAVRLWTSSAMPEVFEGLAPGRYSLIIGGSTQQQKSFVVEDEAQVQMIEYKMWTSMDTAMCAGGIAAVCLLVVLVLGRRRRKI